jgi:hypothetical protein
MDKPALRVFGIARLLVRFNHVARCRWSTGRNGFLLPELQTRQRKYSIELLL